MTQTAQDQPAEKKPATPEETPQELIAHCEAMFEESKEYMERVQRPRWRKNEDLYYNRDIYRNQKTTTRLMFPLALQMIETIMPILTDFFPTFDVMPEEKNDLFFADMMQHRKAQIEERSKFRRRSMDVVRDSLIYSNGLVHCRPGFRGDDEAKILHRIEFDPADLFTWFPAPEATSLSLDDSRYHIFATPMHVEQIQRIWGDEAQGVAGEGFLDEYRGFNRVDRGGQPSDNQKGEQALVKECYHAHPDTETYPNGRMIVWVGDRVLSDEPLPYAHIPYFMIGNYKTAHSLFGLGEPELIKSLIQSINQVMSSIADNVNATGNPIRKVVKSLWAELKQRISTAPGSQVVVNRPDDITWEHPPGLPQSTFAFVEALLQAVRDATGVHVTMEGRRPDGETLSGVAIRSLQEAAQARAREKTSNQITEYVTEVGEYVVWLLQEYDQEVISIRKEQEFVDYDPQGVYDAAGNQEGAEEFDPTTAGTLKDSQFEIQVTAGVRLPSGRAATEERALALFKEGVYGVEKLVEDLAEEDKQGLVEAYHQRQGLQEMVQRQEEMQGAAKEWAAGIEEAVSTIEREGLEGWADTIDEERLLSIAQAFPELLTGEEFGFLPPEAQQRLLIGFVRAEEPQEDEAPLAIEA